MLEIKDICFERDDKKILNHINTRFFNDVTIIYQITLERIAF